MKKKVIIGVIIAGIVVVGVIGIYVLRSRDTQSQIPTVETITSPTVVPAELETWIDPAGFSFQYPKDLSVNNHEEDQDNYAHVELTSKEHPGNIIVWAKDPLAGTKVVDAASWVTSEKSLRGATIFDTTLGGVPAKKILVAQPSKMLIVGSVSDGIVFTVEGTLEDSDYWTKVHDGIVNSFVFIPANSGSSAGSSEPQGGEDTSGVDEEEVLE
ncbi:hypothetical protein A2Z00_00930 [Candidatus Gottesmanbacteria bacterium RBG_13_45_10]|uniref:Uncharacterized protein n=1 Tax=Candidatus Gottesmanbacteria bacterium RBG_13_45_10 TaxID=1798370 RepID=A0A1F5ZHV2_9BACT|nr:MAG: hypothetical protein A2Z00_00930 [Candidatus Gottesmanbacteria bacterium RBG_13_45_10]